ncbi:MAG: AAA family ATPase [Eubacteriales bacterium]|nr:AAA family ATPase [Eubacteriales bacterium]
MKLLDIHIRGFGKLHDLSMTFDPDINIIYGKNEAGKSTLHTFLGAMLFGFKSRSGRLLYESLAPWKAKQYGGSLRFSFEDHIYRIERDFSKAPDDFFLMDETEGVPAPQPELLLQRALNGLSETGFMNTISIGQLKTAADSGMAEELKRYITNLNTTGSIDLSASAAIDYLHAQKRRIEERLQPDAAKNYARTLSEIKKLEEELSAPENDNRIGEFSGLRAEVKNDILLLKEQKEALVSQIEKGKTVLSENHFTDEASIHAYEKETQEVYADYCRSERVLKRRGRLIVPLLFLLLGMGSAFSAVCMLVYQDLYPRAHAGDLFSNVGAVLSGRFEGVLGLSFFPAFLLLSGLALFLLLAAIVLLLNGRHHKKIFQNTERLLSEILRAHAGDPQVNEETMKLFAERMQGFVKLCGTLAAQESQLASMNETLLSLGERQQGVQEQLAAQERQQHQVEQKLTELNNYKNQAEELRRAIADNQALKAEADAIAIASETLTALGKTIQSSIGTYLNAEAGRLISGITGGIYQSLDAGEDMDIRLNADGRMIPLGSVSSGTMDQIYLALRLAAARLIEGGEDILPLLFDDSFALYDDDRLQHTLVFLTKTCKSQLLIFTCHSREAEILTKNGTPYNMICLSPKTTTFSAVGTA